MTTAIIVQARMTSTRLPGKVMMPLGGRPMLACLLERLRRVTLADKIIVATTTNATDDVIAEFCGEEGVSLHRGSEADVLSRYAEAVRKHDVDVVVRVTSDCPLLDPLLVDRIIGVYQQGQERRIDYVSNMLEPTCPYGMAVEVFSRKALLEADAEASDPAEREHVTPFIYWRPERYVLEAFKLDTDLSSYRWTVDTPEDFELVQLLYNEIYPVNPLFTMNDVVELMDSHPAWFHINQHIEQIKPVSICHGRSMNYKTDQESFWAGEFGTEYIQRNTGPALLASNLDFFAKALRSARGVKSCIEFGSNIGMNLKALKLLYPEQEHHAIEINADAAKELAQVIPQANIFNSSILDFKAQRTWDLTLIKGVLIHINPDVLPEVYEALYRATGKYLLVCEYYNPSPVQISYRGHSDRLFKRDFAGEILTKYPDMRLVDYGFAYRRDPNFPQDDITWFLMEKGV